MASVFDRIMLLQETLCDITQPDQSRPVQSHIVLDNYRSIGTRRSANDFARGRFVPGTQVQSGQLCRHYVFGWYVIEKLTTMDPMTVRPNWVEVQLIALPYSVTVQRPAAKTDVIVDSETDIWGAPTSVDAQGYENSVPTVSAQVLMGFSNDADPQHDTPYGNLPAGSITAYCPLASNVLQDDTLEVSDGYRATRWYTVTNIADQASTGKWYMMQLTLTKLAGPNFRPVGV